MYLVLFETNGNQAFIFGTNRQRENVGASFLTKQLGNWVETHLDAAMSPVMITSGKAIVRVDDSAPGAADGEARARALITSVTLDALVAAPGLDVSGAYIPVDPLQLMTDQGQNEVMQELHTAAANYVASRPPTLARFSQLPFVDVCADSGLPVDTADDRLRPGAKVSATALGKRNNANDARAAQIKMIRDRRAGLIDTKKDLDRFFPDLKKLEDAMGVAALDDSDEPDDDDPLTTKELQWVGVVHIDGNSVGKVFSTLDENMHRAIKRDAFAPTGDPGQPDVWRYMAALSDALDDLTERAYVAGVAAVVAAYNRQAEVSGTDVDTVPVVPILLGADDTTVLVAGRYALIFAVAFLTAFEEEQNGILAGMKLTAAAGVAVVKRKFPFHVAYELTEDLCKAAKKVSRDRSLLDFHLLYDTADVDLDRLRNDKRSALRTVRRPFDVTTTVGVTWSDALRTTSVFRPVDDRTPVPRSVAADLRGKLNDPTTANRAFAAVRAKSRPYRSTLDGLALDHGGGSDLVVDGRSKLIDALDLIEILPPSFLDDHLARLTKASSP